MPGAARESAPPPTLPPPLTCPLTLPTTCCVSCVCAVPKAAPELSRMMQQHLTSDIQPYFSNQLELRGFDKGNVAQVTVSACRCHAALLEASSTCEACAWASSDPWALSALVPLLQVMFALEAALSIMFHKDPDARGSLAIVEGVVAGLTEVLSASEQRKVGAMALDTLVGAQQHIHVVVAGQRCLAGC